MNLSSRQLQIFLEIARLRSFAKAAERVHLSPSGLSMLVKEMEEQIGTRLFDRTTRSVVMTDAGRCLQPVAERILDELNALEQVLAGAESARRTRLDVAATPMLSASVLPGVLREFATTNAQVRVRLDDVDVETVRRRVLEGEADIGFGFFVKPAVGLVRQPLCRFRLMRISPPGTSPAGRAASRPWSSLSDLPLIALPQDNPIQALIETQLVHIGRGQEEKPRINLLGTLIGMVQAGLGHAIVPSFALVECLHHRLCVAMLVEPAVHLDLFLVARRGTPLKPEAQAFADALKRAAAREPASRQTRQRR